jgi:circadian clock protein KaiC
MFSFYETPTRLRAKADSLCPALSPLLDSGVVDLLWQNPLSDVIDAYGGRLLETVKRRKVKRLFIDGLTGFKSAAFDPSHRALLRGPGERAPSARGDHLLFA